MLDFGITKFDSFEHDPYVFFSRWAAVCKTTARRWLCIHHGRVPTEIWRQCDSSVVSDTLHRQSALLCCNSYCFRCDVCPQRSGSKSKSPFITGLCNVQGGCKIMWPRVWCPYLIFAQCWIVTYYAPLCIQSLPLISSVDCHYSRDNHSWVP